MKKMNLGLFSVWASAVLLLLSSCKKEYNNYTFTDTFTSNCPVPADEKYYLPITTGTYWIYEENLVDGTGNPIDQYSTDSTVVTGDTILNNRSFQIIRTYALQGSSVIPGTYSTSYFRDSSGFDLTPSGTYFNQSDFTTVFHFIDNYGSYESQLFRISNLFSVPAGLFSAIDHQNKFTANDPNYPYGTRIMHDLYADSVGLLLKTGFFYSNPNKIERRLMRYHIE